MTSINGRQPQNYFFKWKMTSRKWNTTLKKMEEDLRKWKKTLKKIIEDDLKHNLINQLNWL